MQLPCRDWAQLALLNAPRVGGARHQRQGGCAFKCLSPGPLTAYVTTHGHVKATAVKQTKQQRVGPHLFKGTVMFSLFNKQFTHHIRLYFLSVRVQQCQMH